MSTGFTKDQPAEILHDARGIRLVRLDFYYDPFTFDTRESLAQLGEGLVTLISMTDDHKPSRVTIDPENMTRLAHAWLAFLDDCKAAEEQEKAAFQSEIEVVRERAKAIGAEMTDFDRADHYDTFNLVWPATHPLERFNRHWTYGNDNLSLSEVQDRLKQVEKHVAEAQIEACTEKSISTFERQCDRAGRIEAYLFKDGPEYYELSFREHHPFYGFWIQDHLLTAGQVEYRLRYVEGVMKQQASAK